MVAEKEFDELAEEAKKLKEEKAKEKKAKPEEKAEKMVKEAVATEKVASKVIKPEKTVSEETIEFLMSKAEKEDELLRNFVLTSLEGIKVDLDNPRVTVWVTGVRDDGDVAMHVFPTKNNIHKTFEEGGAFERLSEDIKDTILAVTPKTEKAFFDLLRKRKEKVKVVEEKGGEG